jgi:hypothetical protein
MFDRLTFNFFKTKNWNADLRGFSGFVLIKSKNGFITDFYPR